jgi:hypothetical protein
MVTGLIIMCIRFTLIRLAFKSRIEYILSTTFHGFYLVTVFLLIIQGQYATTTLGFFIILYLNIGIIKKKTIMKH